MIDKTDNTNDNGLHYKSPKVNVIEMKVQGVLCQSTGAATINKYTEENLEW